MADYTPIYKGRDFYVPAFQVKLASVDVEATVLRDVIEVTYTDQANASTRSVDKFDTFSLTVSNWDEERRDFKYTGPRAGGADPEGRDTLFDPGKEIEIWMGHFSPIESSQRDPNKPEPLRLMLAGVITKAEPVFNADGARPTLKISGQNLLVKLMNKQEAVSYDAGMRDSDIAKKVGARGNLRIGSLTVEVRTDDNARSKEPDNPEAVTQNSQYDIMFLLALARKNGYDLFLGKEESGGETKMFLKFGPSTKEPTQYELEWGKSIITFQPTLNTLNQASEVTVRGWDVDGKKEIVETVKHDDIPIRGMNDKERHDQLKSSFQQSKEVITDKPFHTKEQARQHGIAQMTDMARSMVTASGSTFGTPDLRAGRKIKITGLGRTYDGTYFLTSTTHTIGANGYITSFNARMEAENK